MILDLDESACKRLISSTHSKPQIVKLLGEIFTSENEVKIIGYLRGDNAQAFIDVLDGVRSAPSFLWRGLITSSGFRQPGFGYPQSPITDPEEVFERVVQDMRPPGFASEITACPALLRSIGYPTIPRWVRRCVEG